MTWYQILSMIGVPTLLGLVVADLYARIKINGRKSVEKRKERNKEELREVIKEEVAPIKEETASIKEDIKCLTNGNQASLRNDLLTCYYRCVEKGFKTENDAENFRDMYEAYHDLKGNSFIDNDIVPNFNKLDLKPNNYIAQKVKLNEEKENKNGKL